MKTLPVTAVLLCLMWPLVGLSRGQAKDDGNSFGAKLSVSQMQEDFDLAHKALEEAHSGLYRYSSKPDLDRAFAAERAKLNRPMTRMDFLVVMSETVALIHCGHTSVDPDDQLKQEIDNTPLFPLRVHPERAGLMVLSNDTSSDETIRPGMELLRINGKNVADILARIWPLLSADGDIETDKRMHIPNFFPLYYCALFGPSDRFTVEARDASGRKVTANLQGVTRADREKNQNPVNAAFRASVARLNWPKENLAIRFLKDPDIAEVRIRYFIGDDFPKWTAETFKTLAQRGTKALILDLRNDGGGQDEYGAMLVSYLTDKSFRYFERINIKTISPSFKMYSDWNTNNEARLRDGTTPDPTGGYVVTSRLHPCLAEQSPAKDPFLGKVIVLIDGGTFSTAADFCAIVHHLKRATFIGEETGGGYYGNNSGYGMRLTLRNSKLQVRIPMYEYWNAVQGDDAKRHGTIPDFFVEAKVADLLRGRDEALNLAMKVALESEHSQAKQAKARSELSQGGTSRTRDRVLSQNIRVCLPN